MNKILPFIIINIFINSLFSQMKTADQNLSLMPWPKEVKTFDGNFVIDKDFTIKIESKSDLNPKIYKASNRFLRNLSDKTGVFIQQGFVYPNDKSEHPSLTITIESSTDIKLGIDESYTLEITDKQIKIIASNDVGAMYGLSTLLQLVTVKDKDYVFPSVEINDTPRFVWRGLMIDVARHFMSIDVIKRNLDAMAYVKLNVFHWHLSDDQGFRIELKKLPLLTEKASDGQFYTQSQIKDVVQYAADRGIRVIPEIDVPGHASALLTAYPEISSKDTIYQIERYAGVFNPTLDPTKDKTYEILEILFDEIAPLFPDEYFHIGGDENAGKHWDENLDIQKFMKVNKLQTNHDLQTYFNIKLERILKKYNKKLMGWDEIMTPNMPKTAIIHSWRGEHEGLDESTLLEAAKKGYKTVLSNGYYIDRMLSTSKHYSVDIIGNAKLTKAEEARILGGEATMWSELVTPLTIDSRIWPRTAAIAERFWSQKEINDVENMYKRMGIISNDLEQLGIMHIRNKQVILRNISNYQNTEALNKLSNISEPLKVYSRNKGGKEYKTYSPFTLFADACNVDAKDAIIFNKLVDQFIHTQDTSIKKQLLSYLRSWISIENELKILSTRAPLLLTVLPYSNRISKISSLVQIGLEFDKLSKNKEREILNLLEANENPKLNLDVELAVSKSLKLLTEYLVKE